MTTPEFDRIKMDMTLDWADGSYVFALRWPDLVRLEGDAGCGAFPLLERLRRGHGGVKDVAHVIRNALIGGGLDSQKALHLVNSYVEGLPPRDIATACGRHSVCRALRPTRILFCGAQ